MSKSNLKALLPVMFGFFIMGFVDIIGVATNHIKADFALSDVMANSLSTALFIWFFILSIPVAMMMNKIGRKSTVLLSFAVQTVAFLVMLVDYSMVTVIIIPAAGGREYCRAEQRKNQQTFLFHNMLLSCMLEL